MTILRYRTTDADETRAVGAALAQAHTDGLVILLQGPLGAGKTTFAQGLALGLGIREPVVSPTFTLVREYTPPQETPRLIHMDFYRLSQPEEAADLGLADYLAADDLVVIEWPERAEAVLPAEVLLVTLAYGREPDTRSITLTARGPQAEQAVHALAAGLATGAG